MNKTKVIFIVLMAFAIKNFALPISISGKVSDANGQPIASAIIRTFTNTVICTTKTDGTYLLKGEASGIFNRTGKNFNANSIEFKNNTFIFNVREAAIGNAKLYNTAGHCLATIYKGAFQQGSNSIPFALAKYGHGLLLLRTEIGNVTNTYTLNPMMNDLNNSISENLNTKSRGLFKIAALDWLQAAKSGYATNLQAISSYNGVINITLASNTTPDFGPNVSIFDPSMPMADMQAKINSVLPEAKQFASQRIAYFFKPGTYNLTVTIGYYIHAIGLGNSPDDVSINGVVESRGQGSLSYFWRGAENLSVTPPSGISNIWSISQAAPFRRMHIKGPLQLHDGGSTSGGYMSDCKIDGAVNSGSQQQFYTRNSQITSWNGGNWNMFFQGVLNAPADNFATGGPMTNIANTPLSREKPYLTIDVSGNYAVFVPALKTNSQGTTWLNGPTAGESMPIDQFYIAKETDNSASINAALGQGKNLILTPGIYNLDSPLEVTRPNTVILGIGFPTLSAQNGTIAMKVADVDGIKISGILFDAGLTESPTLFQVGEVGSAVNHSVNPTCLFDIFARIGGVVAGKVVTSVIINSNNVILDHCWIWRADHGAGVGWTSNTSKNGMIINGNDVIMYGQFMEHHQQYQTIWNGNNGRNYFYQNEIPYEVPTQADFQHGGVNGWASYKVGDAVINHEAWGVGVYAFFNRAAIILENGIEAPMRSGVKFHHMVVMSLGGNKGEVTHVINGTGPTASQATKTKVTLAEYP